MKQTVIEFFQNLPVEKSEQFNKAFELYRKSPNKNLGVERSLNVQGYSERTLENLLYDLQKMHGISDVEKIKVVQSPKSKVPSSGLSDAILGFNEEELRTWAQSQDVTLTNVIEETIVIALESEENTIAAILQEELEKIKSNQYSDGSGQGFVEGTEGTRPDNSHAGEIIVNGAEVVTDASLPLREEFPFLNDKECPNELKILVADKITAWKEYSAAHDQLLKIESGELVLSKEEQSEIAEKAKTAFEENQAIYDELNAYKETGKVLGKHPIFKTLQFQREVEEMSPEQLNKYIGSSSKYFSDNKKSLAKAEQENDEIKIIEIKERVADRELKLSLVNKKLGIVSK